MKKKNDDTTKFYPESRGHWRNWLEEHHDKEQSVWLIGYKKSSGVPSITWSESVDEALCFGWIDSKRKPIDDEKYMQFFSKRKPTGTWSKINKDKIQQLTDQGLMAKAGLDCVKAAKQSGSWTILDEVEALVIPPDLEKEFDFHPGSRDFFSSLGRSVKKMMLQWIVLAKQPETRQKRIGEIAEMAGKRLRPKQFR